MKICYFRNIKILEELSNLKINKFSKLRRFSKNCQVLKSFVFSIFSITRNFLNSHICPLIEIYFVALST